MGAGVAEPPHVIIEIRQLAVLAVHVMTMTRRLVNAQWQGKATA